MGEDYGLFFFRSPDQDMPHLMIRGINSAGEFAGTMVKSRSQHANQADLKGVFGKIDREASEALFRFLEVYNPHTPGWTMGFLGMSESGLTTSLLYEKFDNLDNPPPNSQILKWTHLFNSMGYENYSDVHVDSSILPLREGHPEWKSGLATDINNNGRCVGWFLRGDAFSFNTTTQKFDVKLFNSIPPFGDYVQLWNIANNGFAVGIAKKYGSEVRQIFIIDTNGGDPIWPEDLDAEITPSPHVRGDKYYHDMYTGDVCIADLNEIGFIGAVDGAAGQGIAMYNYVTGAKRMAVEFSDDPRWASLEDIRICDMTPEARPVFCGYGADVNNQELVGFIAYPK